MKRIKRHKIKSEKAESSRDHEETWHDLAYYIHDRVELMHQVFSILKYKELKAMAPECVRNLAIGDLQELCTEELLGISSKRLLATLDGAEPPSDTESSSPSPTPDPMETISLDSISSDEEILSQSSKKKKHKHRHSSKTKSKKKGKQKTETKTSDETTEVSKASRAGLTVLELLELQARARAIRAQLQNEQAMKKVNETESKGNVADDDDDEVEIKEEAPDVVEISSGDEKPDISTLQLAAQNPPTPKETSKPKESTKAKDTSKPKEPENTNKQNPEKTTLTRRISDLIITVPQVKTTRKIKLKRNNPTVNASENNTNVENRVVTIQQKPVEESAIDKSKKKKKRKKKSLEKDGSDHDEITLQLSDSEKMDLLEDLNEKNYDRLSSSSSDSEASSSDTDADNSTDNSQLKQTNITETGDSSEKTNTNENKVNSYAEENISTNENNSISIGEKTVSTETIKNVDNETVIEERDTDNNDENYVKDASNAIEQDVSQLEKDCDKENLVSVRDTSISRNDVENDTVLYNTSEETIEDNKAVIEEGISPSDNVNEVSEAESSTNRTPHEPAEIETAVMQENIIITKEPSQSKEVETEQEKEQLIVIATDDIPVTSENTHNKELDTNVDNNKNTNNNKEKESQRDISEGELSDRESSEVEAVDIQPEVVCISDEEQKKTNKKKKKKEKKAKKEKKCKKSKQDFREGADQNFYKDADNLSITISNKIGNKETIDKTDDDVYEILELSDHSSCYEVEGTVLSKEPTAEEIEALSAKIDEINRDDVIIDEQTANKNVTVEINNPENKSDSSEQDSEYISWKDRYLGSKKVKKVLTTANILNALRKKNKELKRKIEDSKKKEEENIDEKLSETVLEEGSIEHYQTLEPSKYVTQVVKVNDDGKDGSEDNSEDGKTENVDKAVTREMKKDAKQLLKMYKKLMNWRKIKRREKKMKKKQKKKLGDVNAETEAENSV